MEFIGQGNPTIEAPHELRQMKKNQLSFAQFLVRQAYIIVNVSGMLGGQIY